MISMWSGVSEPPEAREAPIIIADLGADSRVSMRRQPAQADRPAGLMLFQDGVRFYQNFVPTVFDHLSAAGDMPPTVGGFIDPGVFADTTVSNRSFEYDTLSDQYASFLLQEIVPDVMRERPLSQDAASRAICGISSGGIYA
jgi:enterochelin esterase-like enzyme